MVEHQFYDEIEFETIFLEVARDGIVYSFIAQRSLMYLDLSACELTLCLKTVFTEEQCRKLMEPNRQILYTLHLDLPKNLENSLRDAAPNADDYENYYTTFYLGGVFMCECVYARNLESCIIQPILSAENKMEKLRRYLEVIKLLKLNICRQKATFLFENLIFVLYPYCTYSELVVEFAETFRFCTWIYYKQCPALVEYILHHSTQIKYNLFAASEWGLNPINGCILFHQPGNITTLLEYGIVIRFQPEAYLESVSEFLGPRRIRRIVRKNIPDRRRFLLLQLLYYVTFHSHFWQGLLYIWRSIPDPYLSMHELNYFYGNVISSARLQNIIGYYKFYFIEETVETDGIVPRPLQHLCRIVIRCALIRNYKLPSGTYQLNAPRVIRNYLNLRC